MLRSLTLLLAFLPSGNDEPKGPYDGVFLVRGVSVWQADGTLQSGRSLLLRDGLIAAVGGPELAAPEARLVAAGPDWIAYPGWIHADLPLGVEQTPPTPFASSASDPRRGPIPAMEWGSRKDLRGWLAVADSLQWDPDKAAAWRTAGFTSGYVLPRQGLLRGRAAWVSLDGQPLGDALLQRDGLAVLALTPSGGGYPSTPMAGLAVLRQAFLDAERWRRLRAAGQSRGHDDPDLQALLERNDRPFLFHANSRREIENVLDLTRDYAGGRPVVILGGREADRLLERLRQQQAAVLFRLDLEDAPKSDEELKIKPEPERPWWQEPARLREERRERHREQVEAFLRLRAGGVPCALVPSGTPKAFREDLQQLLAAGWSADEARNALGPDLARILQLERVGRIEAGAAADLVISRGAWNLEKPDFAWVFADGRGWEFPAKAPEAAPDEQKPAAGGRTEERPAAAEDAPIDPAVYGEWAFTVVTPEGEQKFHVRIEEAGDIETWLAGEEGDKASASKVEFEGNLVRFEVVIEDAQMTIGVTVEVDGDEATAELATPFGNFSAEGSRMSGGGPPAQEPPATGAAEAAPQAGAPSGFFAPGHPEHPVETRADRRPRRPAAAAGQGLLLSGATLYPMTGREPFVGDLLIQDGRIGYVGPTLDRPAAPAGDSGHVIEASGWHITPGIIDPHSHLAIDATNEGSLAITAECRIADMVHPGDVGLYRAAAGGTAIHQTLHGSANPIGGQAAVWELDVNAETIEELLLPGAPQGIKFALGENVKRSNGPTEAAADRFPNTRAGVAAVYERAFTRAQEYAAARARAAGGADPSFRRDVRLDALADILEGKIHIQCHSYRADEILAFLEVCRKFGIRAPTFQHVLEGYKVAPEMAAYGAMASTFSDWWAYKMEVYDAIPWNPYLMAKAGVVTTINSDSDEMIRRLNTEAGKSLRYGPLRYEQALALCTLNGAKNLHIEGRVGTLEAGKDGTISCFDGPPLSTYSRCVLTLARGRVLFERARVSTQRL